MKKFEIVSLGVNCLPRTVLTNHKIKPSKAEGELSCPFDLVFHKLDRITYYIDNEFMDYFDDLFFKVLKRNCLDFRKKGFWQKTDGTVFFHDKDCKVNDKDKLTARIQARIDNFYQILDNETPILFVLNIANKGDLMALYDVLKRKRKNKKFKIAVLDFCNNTGFNEVFNEDIYVLRLPTPIDNFSSNWNKKKFKDAPLGQYVNKVICEFVKEILNKEPFTCE